MREVEGGEEHGFQEWREREGHRAWEGKKLGDASKIQKGVGHPHGRPQPGHRHFTAGHHTHSPARTRASTSRSQLLLCSPSPVPLTPPTPSRGHVSQAGRRAAMAPLQGFFSTGGLKATETVCEGCSRRGRAAEGWRG